MQVQKNSPIVEARLYEGPTMTVVNNELGELIVHEGDYLVGTEAGKITVISGAAMATDYTPYVAPADPEILSDAEAQAGVLATELAAEKAVGAGLQEKLDALTAANASLTAELAAKDGSDTQIATLTAGLATAQAATAALQAKLDTLTALEKQRTEAMAALTSAQAAVGGALGQ
jgi:hypothetical protein